MSWVCSPVHDIDFINSTSYTSGSYPFFSYLRSVKMEGAMFGARYVND